MASCRVSQSDQLPRRHCQINAISQSLRAFPAPALGDSRLQIVKKSFDRRAALEEACRSLKISGVTDFETECRLVSHRCDNSGHCGYLKQCQKSGSCTKIQGEQQSLDGLLTMGAVYGYIDYLSIFKNLSTTLKVGNLDAFRMTVIVTMASVLYDHQGKPWRKESIPVKFEDVSLDMTALDKRQSEYLIRYPYRISDEYRNSTTDVYLMSRAYLETHAFESIRKVGQYRWNDCLVRSLGVAAQCDPQTLYQSMLAKGYNSEDNIDYFLGQLLREKTVESDTPHHAVSWPRAPVSLHNTSYDLVANGGIGTYIGLVESSYLCRSQNKLIREDGHAVVITVFKDRSSNLYKFYTLDFQEYIQYEGLPRGYLTNFRIINKSYSFVKVSNTPIPIDPGAIPLLKKSNE